jgi:septal ring factor EnvC (AmiA/AmiB activator)|tara:strand:- start:1488 stop:2636 length:1149 start_codon:yes stop_codon:yes gene_type:complete
MKEYIKIILCLSLLLPTSILSAQSRTQLEDERNKIIEQIEQTSKNLEKTSSNKKATLSDLKAIENQIKNRKKLIENIQKQLKRADVTIANNTVKIDSLDGDINHLDEQYQQLARSMYLRELAGNKWAYVFSAASVNDAFLRWRYSKQFEAYATQKTDQVRSLQGKINNKTNSVKEEKTYIQKLLSEEKKSYKKLEKDQKRKDEILAKLKTEESELIKDLNKKKKQREKLNREIERIILAELSKSSESTEVSADIKNKKLAWPAKGFISGKFGNQPHPTIKNVRINNNGIDIACKKSAPISAAADGRVISVTTIAGYGNMVIIKHGSDYYSVYSKLAHIIVKKEELIKAGQTIGRLADENAPELHFEFWKGKEKLDPAKWLKK